MVLGFKLQFRLPILTGQKIHTIRADKNDRWKTGRLIHAATGVRTKNYKEFCLMKCISTQEIKIEYDYIMALGARVAIWIDGRPLPPGQIDQLARNDGFQSTIDFFDWFDKDFEGKIIHWTEFKY